MASSGISGPYDYNRPHRDGAPWWDVDVSRIPDAVPMPHNGPFKNNPYTVLGKTYYPLNNASAYSVVGTASWYGTKFHGQATANGEQYDLYGMTAAHKTLPLPSYVRVTNLDNGKSVIVRVNDRGPFYSDRVIDLSFAAAKKLGYAETGTAHVKVEGIDPDRWWAAQGKQPPMIMALPKMALPRRRIGAFSGAHIAVLTALLLLVVSIPIWTNPVPPLSDYVNHLARMHVIADIAHDPNLARFYEIDWAPVPNLMMDIVVPMLARFMSVYLAGQIFLLSMLALMVPMMVSRV